MEESKVFGEPIDVTREYLKRAKSVPSAYVTAALLLALGTLFSGPFFPPLLVVGGVVVTVLLFIIAIQMSKDRKAVRRALSLGTIVRTAGLVGSDVKVTDVSSVDPSLEFDSTTVSLIGLDEVVVGRDFLYIRGLSSVELTDPMFANADAKQEFIAHVLTHVSRSGQIGLTQSKDDWIGKL